MKNKILTLVSTIMLFVPMTLILFRMYFQWALDYAHIMIPCYAAFMVFSGIFTTISYIKIKVQNSLMKVCFIANNIYAVAGIVILGMMLNTHFM